MSDACFWRERVDVPVGDTLRLDGPEGRHAAAVRRLRVDEPVLIIDGNGHGVRGVVTAVGSGFIDVYVSQHLNEPSRAHRWTVVQALAKGGRDELAIEAMTELGVNHVVAWQASRSIVQWAGKVDKGLAKWGSTVREAAKQARRLSVPTIEYASTAQVCRRISEADQAFVLHESAEAFLGDQTLVTSGDVLFIVGPEGGISPDELAAFEAAGARPVLVADHVLRTSTAGVVALAQMQVMSS